MSDRETIRKLEQRLRDLDHRITPDWQQSIIAVAREAIEAELTMLGQRLVQRNYWRTSEVPAVIRASA